MPRKREWGELVLEVLSAVKELGEATTPQVADRLNDNPEYIKKVLYDFASPWRGYLTKRKGLIRYQDAWHHHANFYSLTEKGGKMLEVLKGVLKPRPRKEESFDEWVGKTFFGVSE